MPDQPDIPTTPDAKPKLSRWVIAGVVFLLVPFVVVLEYILFEPGYSITPILLAHQLWIWLATCSIMAIVCGGIACYKIKNRGNTLTGVGLARLTIAASCICLVLVIGCIFAFLGMVAIQPHPAKKNITKTMTSALYLAIKQYEAYYGRLPTADGPVHDYDRLVSSLVKNHTENPRHFHFFKHQINKDDGHPEFKDPWGNDFMVVFSSSGTIHAGTGGIGKTVENSVAIWSKGPNQIDDHGEYDPNSHPPKDDIASWR